jgi:prepilin-type N-terminal cleavage/methylation domain-containing protein
MTPALRGRSVRSPRAFSLLELIVVMVVLSLGAALAVAALGRRTAPRESELASLILLSREAAARRGETIHLEIAASGAWTIQGSASRADGPIRAGQVSRFPGLPLTLIVSPIGSCGFDVRSSKAASDVRIDPLTCSVLE